MKHSPLRHLIRPARLQKLRRSGSAVIITLMILVVITILVVGIFSILQPERISSNSSLSTVRANSLCQMGADHAVALIRTATAIAESGTGTGKFWASQPGRITVFNNIDGTVDTANSVNLFSTSNVSGTDTSPLPDLNQPSFAGNYPIASPNSVVFTTGSVPTMNAQWINVLQDSTAATSSTNQIIGRYAFWVDDELSKINVNTADGSLKLPVTSTNGNIMTGTNSFGFGTPTEMDLGVLTIGGSAGTPISALSSGTLSIPQAIAARSGANPYLSGTVRPFNDASEILQVTGAAYPTLYSDNNFDLTAYNRAPELNIFGEPKINLMVTGSTSVSGTTPGNAMLGPYAYYGQTPIMPRLSNVDAGSMSQVYPASYPVTTYPYGQLPASTGSAGTYPLRQYFNYGSNGPVIGTSWYSSPNYQLGLRIANYLAGISSTGGHITWPAFPGATGTNGFAGKYTPRQIDSIALQIVDLMSKEVYADQGMVGTPPTTMASGFLSGQPITGHSDYPRPVELKMTFTPVAGGTGASLAITNPSIKILINVKWYLPKQFVYTTPYAITNGSNPLYATPSFQVGAGAEGNVGVLANRADAPIFTSTNGTFWTSNSYSRVAAPGAYPGIVPAWQGHGFWHNNLLRIADQNGLPAIDLYGHNNSVSDPDYLYGNENQAWTTGSNQGYGTGPSSAEDQPVLWMGSFQQSVPNAWNPGDYHIQQNYYGSSGAGWTLRPNTTTITVSGGINLWAYNGSGTFWGFFPLGSIPGISVPLSVDPTGGDFPVVVSATNADLNAVIPINVKIPIVTGPTTVGPAVTVDMQVADPFVNEFPGDWVSIPNASAAIFNGSQGTTIVSTANPAFLSQNGGDPAAFWLPPQELNLPKAQRFPSIGFLQYIHTGVFPDPALDGTGTSEISQHGTPFRLLNFAQSTSPSQQTSGGSSYPDWAMLDLFTVPASYQPSYGTTMSVPPSVLLTWGGATTGRLNPNSPLISGVPIPFLRTTPLQAALNNLQYSNTFASDGITSLTTAVQSGTLASLINAYVTGLTGTDSKGNTVQRPFMLPGEICNVPAVAACLYSGSSPAISRNDLVREIVGNLSTRSNTFTVWTAGQVIKKKSGNSQYDRWEPGDTIIGESRMKFLVERYIDYGVDGIPGNAYLTGSDGITGTVDDPVDTGSNAFNPVMTYPLHYKYRIVSTSQMDTQ